MATAEQKIRIAIIVPRLEALGPVTENQNCHYSASFGSSWTGNCYAESG